MNMEYMESLMDKSEYRCPVCGQKRYVTDHGNHEWTVHCSSLEARFWDFERGTLQQTMSKQHWDQSRLDMFFTADDMLKNAN
jgi:hypothetical protein